MNRVWKVIHTFSHEKSIKYQWKMFGPYEKKEAHKFEILDINWSSVGNRFWKLYLFRCVVVMVGCGWGRGGIGLCGWCELWMHHQIQGFILTPFRMLKIFSNAFCKFHTLWIFDYWYVPEIVLREMIIMYLNGGNSGNGNMRSLYCNDVCLYDFMDL